MGFYDYRCLLTGVSLRGARVVLVPLYETYGVPAPVAFGLQGKYNRLGAVDHIQQDANTDAILSYFRAQLDTREFVVDEADLSEPHAFPISTIDQLIARFERNVTESPYSAQLHGRPMLYSLVSEKVWRAIADAALPFPSEMAVLPELFADSPITAGIYGDRIERLPHHTNELSAIVWLMRNRDLAWAPPRHPEQWTARDMRQFLQEAYSKYEDCSPVLEGLRAYEREVAEVLDR